MCPYFLFLVGEVFYKSLNVSVHIYIESKIDFLNLVKPIPTLKLEHLLP